MDIQQSFQSYIKPWLMNDFLPGKCLRAAVRQEGEGEARLGSVAISIAIPQGT